MPQIESTQGTDAWAAARQGRVTASVAAACLNLHPHMSAAKAWRIIRGEEKIVTNTRMHHGITHEPIARAQYEIETGHLVSETGLWVWDNGDWLAASPDGLIGDDGVLEIKCPFTSLYEAVPIHYRIQVLVELICTGRQWADLYCWTPSESKTWRIRPAGTEGLCRKLHEWHRTYVLGGVCPPRAQRKRIPKRSTHNANSEHETV